MKRLMRGVVLCVLCAMLAMLLGGCGMFRPIESLYALPALPEEYSQLQSSIQSVMSQMQAEYATISYGNYVSTIQLLDLDSDGEQETSAVFLRVPSAEEKPLRVCLFRREEDGGYRLTHTLQGEGSSFHSVSYEDLTGNGELEIIVSWQISAKVNYLTAYQLAPEGVGELLSTSYNERFVTADLDGTGGREIVVFQLQTSENENNRAEYYHYQNGAMVMTSVAPLSQSIKDVTEVQSGRLADGVMGIYATCEAEGGELTDILVLSEHGLSNVTLDTKVGMSQTTYRTYTEVNSTDINRDGILEIPWPVSLPNLEVGSAPKYNFIYWKQYDSQGNGIVLSETTTCHSVTDGWYLTIPNSWLGKVTVERDDSRSVRGERAVVFYYWPDSTTTQPAAFLTIYRLTGENRYSRAKLSGRTTLYSTSTAIYCASLSTEVWGCGIDARNLIDRFNLITQDWSAE